MVLISGNLIIPKIWCYFNVNESFITLFFLKIQALVSITLVGKLSYSYSKYNNNLVKSILEIDNTGRVCLKNNINGKLSPMPEFIYNGTYSNENDVLYFFLNNNNSKEKAILQLIKSVRNLNRFIGLFSALTSSGIPVCVKVACFKNDENFSKINYNTLKECLSKNNIVNSETSYIVEDDIKNLFFSDYIFI